MDLLKRFQAGQLVRRLGSTDETEARAAEEQLVSMGGAALKPLFEAAQNGHSLDSLQFVLGRLLTRDTLPHYVEALRSQSTPVAEAASRALAAGEHYEPSELLSLFADARVSKARLESVLQAQLQRVQAATLLRLLPDLTKDARGSVFRLIEKTAEPTIVREAASFLTHDDWWLRLHLSRLLGRFDTPESVQALNGRLDDPTAAVRLEAVKALGQLKATASVPALCRRLSDSDMKVQAATIETLIAVGDVSAVPHLLDALKDDSEYVRRGAVEVLNQVVTVDAIKDLVSALRDQDWWVRVRAADALGTLGGTRVVDAVMGLIRDGDDFVRRYAVEILNTVPDKRAVPALIDALQDPDWWVRERAIDALAKTGDARAVDPLLHLLHRDTRAIPLCVRALARLEDVRAVEPICQLARSESAEIRREALQALTTMSKLELPESTRSVLMETLQDAGVSAGRTNPLPMEVRGTYGPDTGRMDTHSKRPTPTSGVEGVSHESTRALNFQRLEPGTVLVERFRVLQRIGGGGFGTVYLVEDVVVREELVLKILSPQLSMDEAMIKRFVQELKLTRRITHANVIRIYDLLDLRGAHAISMEHFVGRDLGTVLRQDGPLSVPRALHVAEQVLEGLSAAHALEIIHRDIKPANLLLAEDDTIKIVDFGLAAVSQTSRSRLTQSGILVGTPEYISPEQITGHTVDARADLYSLGVVLYEVLSGKQPFAGANAVNVLFQHLEAEVPPLDQVASGIPPSVNELVMRSMSRFADDRPKSAAAMLEMLRHAG